MFPEYCLIVNQVMYQTCQTFVVMVAAATAAKSLQSCPTLCDPRDGSPPGSSVHGIFQAKVLEWDAIAFSIVVMVRKQKAGFHFKPNIQISRAGIQAS